MITAYREDNDDVEFKFVHVFARIETCDKWKEVRTALAKANVPFDPNDAPTPAAVGRPIGNKKAKAARDSAPSTLKSASSAGEIPRPMPSSSRPRVRWSSIQISSMWRSGL